MLDTLGDLEVLDMLEVSRDAAGCWVSWRFLDMLEALETFNDRKFCKS